MKRLLIPSMVLASLLASLALTGCTSTTIEWGGRKALRDADGKILVAANGEPYYESAPNRYHTNRHWTDDTIQDAVVKANPNGSYEASVGKRESIVNSAGLTALVEASFKGASELAAKVGAAIATCGGSVAGEAGAAAISKSISNFVARGGSADNATVTCKDGSCTITDGTITETCTDCIDCTP